MYYHYKQSDKEKELINKYTIYELQLNEYKRSDNAERIRLNIEREEYSNAKNQIASMQLNNSKLQTQLTEFSLQLNTYVKKYDKAKAKLENIRKMYDPNKKFTIEEVDRLKKRYNETITELEGKIKNNHTKSIECDQTMASLKTENEHMRNTIVENSFMQGPTINRPKTATETNHRSPNLDNIKLEDFISKKATYLTEINEIDRIIKGL